MDAQLEEVNKQSKLWHRGATIAVDWLHIFRNLDKLSKVIYEIHCFSGFPMCLLQGITYVHMTLFILAISRNFNMS